jgi:hypothetical protein
LTEPEGCRLVAEFFANFLGARVDGPLRVVEAPGHAFADARRKPNAMTDKYVLADQPREHRGARSGDGRAGRSHPISRECLFRRGIGVERARWIGSEITGRAPSGHINMGVYAEVLAGGEIAVGDALLGLQGNSTGG